MTGMEGLHLKARLQVLQERLVVQAVCTCVQQHINALKGSIPQLQAT